MSEPLIEYVSRSRAAMTILEIAADLAALGKHGADWPRASADAWKREIEKAISEGSLVVDGSNCVRLPQNKSDGVKQLDLF